MNKLALLLVFFTVHTAMAQNYREMLIPYPKECKFGTEKFIIDTDFAVSVLGNPNERIYGAATRMLDRLKGRTGLFINQYEVTPEDRDSTRDMVIEVKRPGILGVKEDESYTLSITALHIRLSAPTDLGALRGLETLLQLLQNDRDHYYFNSCIIHDAPRFPWRGLMLDECRHFLPVNVVERNIDGMAAVKMNVLHLHLSDDQGFRVECKTFPRLNEMGSDGQYFTHAQIREIVRYAADRGIRVVPEFDIPGHATSWLAGYPELGSGPGPYKLEHKFGVFDATINPTKAYTYQFFDAFFKEMTALFPDAYVHIGGDENSGKEWNNNPSIQEFMKEHNIPDSHHLQAYFNKRILAILTKYGKRMIGWDEIMEPDLPKDIVIQSWRGKQGLVNAARNGFPVILSNGYYIDLMEPASQHYLNDPLPEGISLTQEQKKLVWGGEATMWSEMVTPETVDSRIWPRTAAIAERLWSPYTVVNVDEMYVKLDRISLQLEQLGLTQEKNYGMLLRRLTGSYDVSALRTFVDVVEPVKGYDRLVDSGITYTNRSPFTHVVDAARPDARDARKFNMLVDQYLLDRKNKDLAREITQMLTRWINNGPALKAVIDRSPVLKEIEPLSEKLVEISKMGMKAMEYLQKNKSGSKKWHKNSEELIVNAKKQCGLVQLMIIPGLTKLLDQSMKKS